MNLLRFPCIINRLPEFGLRLPTFKNDCFLSGLPQRFPQSENPVFLGS